MKRLEGEKEKDDYRFAMLAAEIRRSYVKNPMTVKLKDFLLNFGKVKTKSKKQSTIDSKRYWAGLAGIKIKDKV